MERRYAVRWFLPVLAAFAPAACRAPGVSEEDPSAHAHLRTRHVLFVTIDGLRPAELFQGADPSLLDRKKGGVRDAKAARARWDDPDPVVRRRKLLPFFWSAIAERGQVFGHRLSGSPCRVTNGRNFSYPGYAEMTMGWVDLSLDSNAKRPNPNPTVFDLLRRTYGPGETLAVFGSWDVFPFILHEKRSGVPVNAGWSPLAPFFGRLGKKIGPTLEHDLRLLDDLAAALPPALGTGERFDAFSFEGARACLRALRPRVLWLALGEPDDWAHRRRYDLHLEAVHRADRFLRLLWDEVQSDPSLRDSTTLVCTSDHGRGGGAEWTSHGARVRGSEWTWIALLGPDTPPLGLRRKTPSTLSQVAATLAGLCGLDLPRFEPRAAPQLKGAVIPGP